MSLAKVMNLLGLGNARAEAQLSTITRRRDELSLLTDEQLKAVTVQTQDFLEVFALTAVVAERVLGMRMFDVQLLGALALQRGEIAEMQTGEGKTLAAVPAIVWFAMRGRGLHVLTANDYLAKRDAEWMGGIFRWFGLEADYLAQGMTAERRRAAYGSDVTYATANEVGFDYLRDSLALSAEETVQRPFAFAVIDEADSILLDEARIPLVIAGGLADDSVLAFQVDPIVRNMRRDVDFYVDENARNVRLSDLGIRRVERTLGCGNLFVDRNLPVLTAAQDALHAHALLRCDVDYVVRNGAIELVDEFKGRVAQDRRWPAGLQSAIEAKEHVALKTQGRILGSITVQNLVKLYEKICGMTGTAVTQAGEFWHTYKLPVTVIPTNRPMIRQDLDDILYADRKARDEALVKEVLKVHATGRPVLVGTASVHDSERISQRLTWVGVPHSVLNARQDEHEAEIVAQAGALGAVTISTNMAGRGTDILLGGNPPRDREKVVALGGLYVMGTTRHEARRIDHQLRGRAGRQGDPGTSRFFLSLEDDLIVRFGVTGSTDVESAQRVAESQNFEIRQLLWKYEVVQEHQRLETTALRRRMLSDPEWSVRSMLPEELYESLVGEIGNEELEARGRRLVLSIFDDLWADYLSNIAELRGGIHWVSWGGRDPLFEFLTGAREIYSDFGECFQEETEAAFRKGLHMRPKEEFERGATWTYLTTDQPFGLLSDRILENFKKKLIRKRG